MRIGTASLPKSPGLTLAATVLLLSPLTVRAQSNPRSQTIYLPDPTPREMDPHLALGDNSQVRVQGQALIDQQNAKRRQLVEWAANELVTLSERVQVDVIRPKTPATMALAAADTQKIEQIAKTLSAALKAH